MLYSILHYSTTLCPRCKFWYLSPSFFFFFFFFFFFLIVLNLSLKNFWARPGRGLAASSSTSNRVNSKLFKYQKKVELCYIVDSCWRVGFPCGRFPPLWCFPPRCLGAAPLRFLCCRAYLLALMSLCAATMSLAGRSARRRDAGEQ